MKIIFLNPPYSNYGGVQGMGGKSPPLNLGYLAAFMREKGHQVSILDAEALGLTYKKIRRIIEKQRPSMIGMTVPTAAFKHASTIAKVAKEVNPNIIVVVGGPHPTALPERTLKETPYFDIVVMGEGEFTLDEIAELLKKGKKISTFRNVKGIAFRGSKGKIIVNPRRERVKDMDVFPFPARDLMPHHLYESAATKRLSGKRSTSMITGRGCPFNCTYCTSNILWGQAVSVRSPKRVVDEMEECVKKYGIDEFNMHDELFTLNPDRVIEICKEIVRRKLKVAWICMARVDTISRNPAKSKEMLYWMKKAGCEKISFGLESGNQKVLDLMRKRTTLEQARQAVKIVKKSGIELHASFMIGNIGETKKTVMDTIRFAKSLDLDVVSFFVTIPYPGTELYDYCIKNKLIDDNLDWDRFSPITNKLPVMSLPDLSPKEIFNLYQKAYNSYYFSPKYIAKQIGKIKSWQDIHRIIEGGKLFLNLKKKPKFAED